MRKESYYRRLGRLLELTRPELADELSRAYSAYQPHTKDFSLLQVYLNGYLHLSGTAAINITADKRAFTCVILKLYRPSAFDRQMGKVNYYDGLPTQLAMLLGDSKQRTGQLIGEAVSWYKIDETFRKCVDEKVEKLKNLSSE